MKKLLLKPSELVFLRNIMPIVCVIVPWEFYFYATGWGYNFPFFI